MGLSHWLTKILGGLSIGLAIIFLVSIVFLGAMAERIDLLPEIVGQTVDEYIEKNPEQAVEFFSNSEDIDGIWDVCDQSEKTKEECEEELTYIWVQEQGELAKVEWTEELEKAFSPFVVVAKYTNVLWTGFVIFLLVGLILFLHSSRNDWVLAMRKTGWRVGIISVFPLIILMYLSRLDLEGIQKFIEVQVGGVPDIVLSFLSLFVFTFFSPIFDQLFVLSLSIVVIGFGMWGMTFITKVKSKKK